MRLISRGSMYAVDARFDISACQSGQGITSIDSDGSILRLDPFPVVFGVEDLECSNGLTEEQSHASKVCVTGAVELPNLLIFLGSAYGIVHVPKMVLALVVIGVIFDELVF